MDDVRYGPGRAPGAIAAPCFAASCPCTRRTVPACEHTAAYYIFSAFIAVTAAASIAINFWEVSMSLPKHALVTPLAPRSAAQQRHAHVRPRLPRLPAQVRKNLVDTARMARHTCPVVVLRRPSPTSTLAAAAAARAGPPPPRRLVVDSSRLVPGDVFEVPSGVPMPCDAVLACGGAAVNEAMLTGESTVVSKTPWAGAPPGARADDPPEARHTLFCGSMVLQLRAPPPGAAAAAAAGGLSAAGVPLAVVARPGFDSAKGRLVQSILHPAPLSFGFERQALVFVAALFAAALVGFAVNAQGAYVRQWRRLSERSFARRSRVVSARVLLCSSFASRVRARSPHRSHARLWLCGGPHRAARPGHRDDRRPAVAAVGAWRLCGSGAAVASQRRCF